MLVIPGTDHASIATEAKVVGMLREKGIKKSDLPREEFLNYAWEWKEKYGGIILDQLKTGLFLRLGKDCFYHGSKIVASRYQGICRPS
ncbi:MAG: class I tRNA ligase family protein [Saprospiraceae bacterium]